MGREPAQADPGAVVPIAHYHPADGSAPLVSSACGDLYGAAWIWHGIADDNDAPFFAVRGGRPCRGDAPAVGPAPARPAAPPPPPPDSASQTAMGQVQLGIHDVGH